MEFSFLSHHHSAVYSYTGDYEQKVHIDISRCMHSEFWKYTDPNIISYDYNTDGFRAKEFSQVDWKNTSVIVGCSYIFGQGVENENTVSEILNREYGVPFVNGGVFGASNRVINDNALVFMKKYNPKKVIILWSHENRSTWMYEWDKNRNKFSCETIMPSVITDSKKRKELRNKGVPSAYFLPDCVDTIHSNMSYKATQDLLGNKQYFIEDKNNPNGEMGWIKPRDPKLYEWRNKIERGEIEVTLDTLAQPEIYELINNLYARDLRYDKAKKKICLGHHGAQMNRDIADLIYRENFK